MTQTSWLMRLLPLFLTTVLVGGSLAVAFS